MKKIIFILCCCSLVACTEQQRARKFGGTADIKLEPGKRLVNATWKQNDLWILTKDDTTAPQTYYFKESSSFGIIQGTVQIVEQ